MSFGNYQSQAPKPGKLVAYTLYGLRNPDGSSPVLMLEHLGRENRAFWNELLMGGNDIPSYGNTPSELNRAHSDRVAKYRDQLTRHSARHLKNAFHADDSPAVDADIAAFIAQIPEDDIIALHDFARNPQPWREYPIPTAKPEAVAEK